MLRSAMRPILRSAMRFSYALLFAATVLLVPARVQAADDAAAMAQRGAAAFKARQFLDAARDFERAWQLDPADNLNLRYAGRAWQEVGHWHKARLLLERYIEVEKDPSLRQSVTDKLEALRKASSVDIAEALAQATETYPQGRLEPEAALALEDVGDERSLRRAASLWEVAKLAATTDADRDRADAAGRRLKDRLRAPLPKTGAETPVAAPAVAVGAAKAPDPAPTPQPAATEPAAPPPVAATATPALADRAPWRTPLGWTLAGAGLATAVGGIFLLNGTLADADAWDRKVATQDASGKVIGFGTGPDAERRSADDAAAINRGWLIGGATTAVGLGLGVVGGLMLRSQPDVALSPLPGGFTVAGRF